MDGSSLCIHLSGFTSLSPFPTNTQRMEHTLMSYRTCPVYMFGLWAVHSISQYVSPCSVQGALLCAVCVCVCVGRVCELLLE